ncbi:hypothetical protein EJ08DRAFT_387809 [Tothia fuscella]|uniref:Uncharacterized protein n=1 Tax=Tothia fuscella TaxID=1048955 RepID=A0A9P4NYZ0_9PEZI|nr:hypothetical protein EJ08DRAFT_387809 [Tothia fuscella]
MAATRPQLSHLKTPLSATYPSELRSPCVSTPTSAFIKLEAGETGQKTPISPPAAYLDFLSKLSPTVLSPQSAGARFTFPEKPRLPSTASSESVVTTASTGSYTSTAPAVSSRPTSPRSHSSSRSSSCSSCSHDSLNHKPDPINTKAAMVPPQSPFARPNSARTPRRLLIPQSPYSPGSVRSPMSAASMYSPYSAAFSPRDPSDPDQGKRTTAVSVRSVVTRTVTYASSARTPLVEPVPPSKKRKTEDTSTEP